MKVILIFLEIYFLPYDELKLYCACAASVMDSTQDSGSWDVGSTPTWRIIVSQSPNYKC